MKRKLLLAMLLFPLLASATSFAISQREDSQLWEMWSNDQLFLATFDGVERFSFDPTRPNANIVRMSSAEGSGNKPVDLDIITQEDLIVLTSTTLDLYSFGKQGVYFRDSVALGKKRPLDVERANLRMFLVVYESGVESFGVNLSNRKLFRGGSSE